MFFCCGAPGAIDYIVLALRQSEMIGSRLRSRLYGYSSACLRCPGAAFAASLLIQDGIRFRGLGCFLLGVLVLVNGAYYGHQAAWSAGRRMGHLNTIKDNSIGEIG